MDESCRGARRYSAETDQVGPADIPEGQTLMSIESARERVSRARGGLRTAMDKLGTFTRALKGRGPKAPSPGAANKTSESTLVGSLHREADCLEQDVIELNDLVVDLIGSDGPRTLAVGADRR